MTKVSIVVCTYSMERYGPFSECIESVFDQEYDSLEVALVVDGSEEVYERVESDFGREKDVIVHKNDENQGISYSRTKSAELASGEVVAFIDDDATAELDWVQRLVGV